MNGVKIANPKQDDRVEKILQDPDTYFSEARERARAEVQREVARERKRRRTRSARA